MGLKPRSFSQLPASYSPEGLKSTSLYCRPRPCGSDLRLAGVPASTHNPQVVRDTMLYARRSRDPAYLAVPVPRKDIDLPYYIAVRLKPAGRAAIDAPPGFVSVIAVRTSLRAVALIYQLDFDAFGLRLVLNILADLAVIPSADLLVGLLTQIHLIRRVAHIPDSNDASLTLNCGVHNSPADLMLNISHDSTIPGPEAGLGVHPPLVTAGTSSLSANSLGKTCQPLAVTLCGVPSCSARDDSGLPLIAHYGRVNLTKIHRDNIISWRIFGLFPIFYNEMPIVAPGLLIVDKAHLQEAQNRARALKVFIQTTP
jgi:hypothetical protein